MTSKGRLDTVVPATAQSAVAPKPVVERTAVDPEFGAG